MKDHELDKLTQNSLESYETVEDMVEDYLPGAVTAHANGSFAFVHDGHAYAIWNSPDFWCGVELDRDMAKADKGTLIECLSTMPPSFMVFDAILYGDTLEEAVFATITYVYAGRDRVAFQKALNMMTVTEEDGDGLD